MKRKTILNFVGLFLVVLVGAGVSYWGIKKYRAEKRKANQEYRYEGRMGKPQEGFDGVLFKKRVLADGLLEEVVKEHQLVSAWGVSDVDAAKARIREKFVVHNDGSEVKVSYQDNDKAIAQKVLKSIVTSYYKSMKRRRIPGGEL